MGTKYPNPFALGKHSYAFSLFEHGGIVYTCRGGHIDITHLRKLADWTAYLTSRTMEVLLEDRTQFTFRMREPSLYHVQIAYPARWPHLPAVEREAVAQEIAIEMAQYLAYTCSTWHEILTWFGFKGAGFWPEYESAFSWEDDYSNVLGCRLGAAALRDPDRTFCEAMTMLLNAELRDLGVQPKPMARRAGEAVRGWWFTGDFCWLKMVKRNFDIGLDDGLVTPWLVPGLTECQGAVARAYPAPTLAQVERRGFSVKFEIEPREWEKDSILDIIRGTDRDAERIEPARHFRPIMAFIRGQAVERYGPLVDNHSVRPGATRHSKSDAAPMAEHLAALAARWLSEGNS